MIDGECAAIPRQHFFQVTEPPDKSHYHLQCLSVSGACSQKTALDKRTPGAGFWALTLGPTPRRNSTMTPWAPLLVLTGLILMVNGQAAPSGSAATTDYGFTINMKLPYPPELADQNSPQFTLLSNRIKPCALQLLQTLLPDCTAVTVSSFLRFFPPDVGFIIEPPPEEGSVLAKCLATFPNDNHTDEEVQRAFDQTVINNSSMLGDIEVLFSNPSTAAPSTSPSTAPSTSPGTAPPTSPGTAPPTSPGTAPPTGPGTAPHTSSGYKPGRKSKRPYPRRTARSRTRPRTGTSDSSTTSRPSTVNVWSSSTTSARNNTERSSTGSQPSMEGSSVTAKPSTVRATTVGVSDITNIPTGKSNPTGPQNIEDVTATSTSKEIISSTTLRNPRTFPPSGEVFAATVQFKVENVTIDNMEMFKRIMEDQLLKVFESNPDFISAQVALLRQGSVYIISILYFLHRAPSNQAIVDVLSKFLKENNMYIGPFKIDLRSIRSGDAVLSDHGTTTKPGSNSEASLAITRSTVTSKSGTEPGISGSQGSGMDTGPPNSVSTTGLNESQKSTPASGGPSVPGVTVPSTTHATNMISRSEITTISRFKDTQEPGMSTGSPSNNMPSTSGPPRETTGYSNGVSSTGSRAILNTQSGASAIPTTEEATGSLNGASTNPSVTLKTLSGTSSPSVTEDVTRFPSAVSINSSGLPESVKTTGSSVMSTNPSVTLITPSGASGSLKTPSETSRPSVHGEMTRTSTGVSTDPSDLPGSQKTTRSSVVSPNPNVSFKTPPGVSDPSVAGKTTGSSSDVSTEPIVNLKTPSPPGSENTTRPSLSTVSSTDQNESLKNPSGSTGHPGSGGTSVSSSNNVSSTHEYGASGSSRPQETTRSSSNGVFSTSSSTGIQISLRGSDSPGSGKTTSSSDGLSPSSLKTIHGSSGSTQPGDTTKSSSQSVSSTGPDSSVILKTTSESSSPRGARLTSKSFINGYSTKSISAETGEISITTAESKQTTVDASISSSSWRAVTGSSVTNSGIADSVEGTFPMYGRVLLGLLAAAFVMIPSLICLAAYTNLLGRFS